MANSMPPPPSPGAGWHTDPHDPDLIRYWDGRVWTDNALPKPRAEELGKAAGRVPWWQTWWVVVPGLVLCAPFGLVGLWRRPGLTLAARSAITLTTVAFLTFVVVSNDDSTPTDDGVPAVAIRTPDSASATPAPPPTPAIATPAATAESVVPRLVGLSQNQARRELAAVGLIATQIEKMPSARPRGTVLRQGADQGTSLPTGSGVTLVIAEPYPRVPDVVGGSKAEAARTLRRAGFRVEFAAETRTSGQDGAVLAQRPAAADRVKPASVVTVVVANVVRPVAPPPPVENCTAGYSPCLTPASDYDCGGGSGNGPAYAYGPIRVTGSDPYDLDADGDGVACES